jgi:double-stranded uracil-DNA glycosylase
VGFSRSELESYRGGTLPDLLWPDVRLLFVGINPGLRTVATQSHFSRRGNRFYPALYHAGITDHVIDASAGFRTPDLDHLRARGIGITSLVAGATARADELEPDELVAGARALAGRVAYIAPAVVAILGISAYRVAFAEPRAVTGRQPSQIAGAQLWVVPNPSGLNAHETVASLAAAYREVAIAAGIDVHLTNPGVSASCVGTPREGTSG